MSRDLIPAAFAAGRIIKTVACAPESNASPASELPDSPHIMRCCGACSSAILCPFWIYGVHFDVACAVDVAAGGSCGFPAGTTSQSRRPAFKGERKAYPGKTAFGFRTSAPRMESYRGPALSYMFQTKQTNKQGWLHSLTKPSLPLDWPFMPQPLRPLCCLALPFNFVVLNIV